MADLTIDILKAVPDTTTSIEVVKGTAQAIAAADTIKANNFFSVKDNSAVLVLDISTAGSIILKAGDAYPENAVMGDLTLTLPTGMHFIYVDRMARFENLDGSLNAVIGASTVGKAYAVGKNAGLLPVANQ